MKNDLTAAELATIKSAYSFIESPCKFCAACDGSHCKIFDVDIAIDEQCRIPCRECEDTAAEHNFI